MYNTLVQKNTYIIIVSILYLLLAIPVLGGEPLWDDISFIFNNSKLIEASNPFVFWFSDSGSTRAWPLSYSVFWLISKVFGHKVIFFKIVSILLHLFNSVIFKNILTNYTKNKFFLLFGFGVFLLHPMNIEVISWTIQLNTLLATFFFLLCWREFLFQKDMNYIKSCLFFFFSLAAKPIAIPFFILFFFDKKHTRNNIKIALVLFSFVGSGLYFVSKTFNGIDAIKSEVITRDFYDVLKKEDIAKVVADKIHTQSESDVGEETEKFEIINTGLRVKAKLVNALSNYRFYLLKFLIPVNQMLVYPKNDPSAASAVVALFLFIGISFSTFLLKKEKLILAGYTFSLLSFFPVSGIFYIPYMKYSNTNDHWGYLINLGFLMIVIGVFIKYEQNKIFKTRRFKKVMLLIFLIVGLRFNVYAQYFNNQLKLMEYNYKENPNSLFIIKYLASIYENKNQLYEASKLIEAGLRIDRSDVYLVQKQEKIRQLILTTPR